jgi:cell division protein FtsB
MRNNFQIGEDGSIFSIGDDGTIHRIAKIDSSGNVESKSSNSLSIGILCFLLIIAVITSIVLGTNLSSAKSSQSSLNSQISELRQKNNNLESEKNSLYYKFNALRERFPLKITRIELANSGDNYNYGQTLYASTLKYLSITLQMSF